MAFKFNTTTIPSTGTIKFNGTSLTKLIFNGVTSWGKQVALIPKLTSNSGSGVTVSANSVNTSTQQAYAAFDNNETTRWHCAYTTGTNWLQVKFSTKKVVEKMIVSANKNHGDNNKQIALLGSNDGINWTTLVSKYNVTTDFVTTTKTITNTNGFTYFRLEMYNCTMDRALGACAGVATLQLYGYDA